MMGFMYNLHFLANTSFPIMHFETGLPWWSKGGQIKVCVFYTVYQETCLIGGHVLEEEVRD